MQMSRKDVPPKVLVWDPLVRFGHWLLVIAFFVAYFTEDDFLTQPVWAGYVVAAIVVVRIVWGFTGSRHARFADFACGPAAAAKYLGSLLRGKAPRYVGHSPAGGAMVIALLLGLAVTTGSGLAVYAYDRHAGPLAGLVAPLPADGVPARVSADSEAGAAFEAREHFWEEVHEVSANVTLFLVILHIGGVLLASFVHKENLVSAMVTGKKRAAADVRDAEHR
jgi:cytochrome b